MARDSNPFDDDDVNPFSNVAGHGSKTQLPPMRSGLSDRHGDAHGVPSGQLNDPRKRDREIAAWEADLKRREQDIKRREDALSKVGFTIEEKNWPAFYPIIHHDIAKEIPVNAQKMQYLAFASWLGILTCLVWNCVAVLACCISGAGIKIFFLAVIYALSGCPLSYILWYKPLYKAMRTDSALHFGWFFIAYMVHLSFCVIAAIAPPIVFEGRSLTGFLATFDTFPDNGVVGILYLIGSCLFSLEALLSALVIERVYSFFRGGK